MKISVVIVNYNSLDYLLVCLDSVYKALTLLDGDGEVLVVDNNSDVKPQKALQSVFPKVKFLQNHTNKGFSQANNQAIRKAQGEYVLLLNPDTVLPEDCLLRVCGFADAHPDAGAVGIRGISSNGTVFPEHRRNAPTLSNMLLKYTRLCDFEWVRRHTKTFYDYRDADKDFYEVEVTSGSFMLLNRRLLGDAILLPEDYFMYFEDTDLCMRLRNKGCKIYYLPVSFLHFKSVSSNRYSTAFVKNFFDAMNIYLKKYSPGRFTYYASRLMSVVGRTVLSVAYSFPKKSKMQGKRNVQQHSTATHSYKEIIQHIESDKGEHFNEIYNPELNIIVGARYYF